MSRVLPAKISRRYIEGLPSDVRKTIESKGLSAEEGREEAWARALEMGSYTEISSWSPGDLVLTHWRIALKYDRDPGEATSRFLDGLKQGKLLGTRCQTCSRTLLPPRIFCEWCFKDIDGWIELSGQGEVSTYSISYLGTDPQDRLKEPVIISVIWLDGTKIVSPSSRTVLHAAGLLHFLGEIDPKDVKIGTKVRPVWRQEGDRTGSILDIKYFSRVG